MVSQVTHPLDSPFLFPLISLHRLWYAHPFEKMNVFASNKMSVLPG